MKRFYRNTQTFAMSRMFSVRQRKFGWLLSRHPKAFKRHRGARGESCVVHSESELTAADLDAIEKTAREEFTAVAAHMMQVAKLRQKLGGGK